MVLIKILSLILLLPLIYPLKKLYKKKELNFFDFILIFSALFFAIVPLKSNEEVFLSIGLIIKENSLFVFYCLLFYFILLVYLSMRIPQDKNTPINITYFLNKYPDININFLLKIILIIIPIFSITYYVPKMSLMNSFAELRDVSTSTASYEESSMVKFFTTIFNLSLAVTLKLFFQNIRDKKVDLFVITSIIIYLVNLALLPRRTMLLYGVFGIILFYSTNRKLINKKILSIMLFAAVFMYTVYFPFYNIIRRSPVDFDLKDPITSIEKIYNYGITSYDNNKEEASEMTDGRAIGLYRALYWITKNENIEDATWGKVTLLAIDHAIPKVLNPNKGLGSEKELEKRMGTTNDSADSVLLLAIADFSFFSFIFTPLIFFIVYKILFLISKNTESYTGKTIIMFYLTFYIFKMSFSVEQKLDGIFSSMVSFIITIFLIILLDKSRILNLKNNLKPKVE